MHTLSRVDARKLASFNACLINRSIGLRARFNFKTGAYVLRDRDGKIQKTAFEFSAIENKAEILADRPIRLAA
jgi:hypothetical protein